MKDWFSSTEDSEECSTDLLDCFELELWTGEENPLCDLNEDTSGDEDVIVELLSSEMLSSIELFIAFWLDFSDLSLNDEHCFWSECKEEIFIDIELLFELLFSDWLDVSLTDEAFFCSDCKEENSIEDFIEML